MKYYLMAEIRLDNKAWVPDYLANVTRLVHEQEGRFLARTSRLEQLEGEDDAPDVVALIEFPSREAANATSVLSDEEIAAVEGLDILINTWNRIAISSRYHVKP